MTGADGTRIWSKDSSGSWEEGKEDKLGKKGSGGENIFPSLDTLRERILKLRKKSHVEMGSED